MPRAIWSGNVAFGLVNVPVRMYSAIDEQDVRFHYLHVKDDSRIGYEKVCKQEGKPVPDDEIVKAYELRDGQYVYVTDEDFEAAQPEGYKSIDIRDFVPYDEIDPIYFERTYYLGPAEGAEKAYSLLLRAMEDAGLAAIASYVMRDRQHLGCLRPREGVITLEQMYFADEIRPVDEIRPRKASVGRAELRMAGELIDKFTGSFDPTQYEDTYREALLELIRRKRKGEEIHREPEAVEEEPTDLLSALKASVERHASRSRGGRSRAGSLDRLSKSELEGRAREAGIRGRSKMTKDELVDALRAAA
ncbi:MAG TPA: Ku protein [Gaiellaceae bacterium]